MRLTCRDQNTILKSRTAKSDFPLLQNANTQALAQELGRATVRVNGQPNFPHEVTTGYHSLVTLKTARVASA